MPDRPPAPPLIPLPPQPEDVPWPTVTWAGGELDPRVDRDALEGLLEAAGTHDE